MGAEFPAAARRPPWHTLAMATFAAKLVLAAAIATAIVAATGRAAAADPPSTSQSLAAHLTSRARDRAIRADVLAWHRTMTNGCVAYASTALRHIGVAIDERGVLDGDGVSRLTRGLVRHLEDGLGWQRITAAAALAPGDLLFTTDVACCPGYPAHVFVFLGWKHARRQIARIADNTGFRKVRPLAAGGDRDGFAFALRSPPAAGAR